MFDDALFFIVPDFSAKALLSNDEVNPELIARHQVGWKTIEWKPFRRSELRRRARFSAIGFGPVDSDRKVSKTLGVVKADRPEIAKIPNLQMGFFSGFPNRACFRLFTWFDSSAGSIPHVGTDFPGLDPQQDFAFLCVDDEYERGWLHEMITSDL